MKIGGHMNYSHWLYTIHREENKVLHNINIQCVIIKSWRNMMAFLKN